MRHMRRILSVALVLSLFLGLMPAGMAAEPKSTAWIQFMTEPIFDAFEVSFENDDYGELVTNGAHMRVSPYGEPLLSLPGNVYLLGDQIYALYQEPGYALWTLDGKRLTGNIYEEVGVIDGYIRCIKSAGVYDFYTLAGKKMPAPKLPQGVELDHFLTDELVAAGNVRRTPPDYERRLALYNVKGEKLSGETSFINISHLTDGFFAAQFGTYRYGVLDMQGNLLDTPPADSIWTDFDNGGFLTAGEIISSADIDVKYRYSRYDANGKELWTCVGTRGEILFRRYFAYCDAETQNMILMDDDGPIDLPEGTVELGGECFGPAKTATDVIPLGAEETPLFYARTADGWYTVYDSECNVVLPTRGYRSVLIGSGVILVTRKDGSHILLDAEGERIAELPEGDFRLLHCGFLLMNSNGKYAVYNLQGEQVTEAIYDLYFESNGFGLVCLRRNNKFYLVDANGREQNEEGFDDHVTFGPMGFPDVKSHFGSYRIDGRCGIVRYVGAEDGPFADVHRGDWFCDAVETCYAKGLMSGVSTGRFRPTGTTTRAMLVQVLYNYVGTGEVCADHGFTDVPKGAWYADAVNWAAAKGIVNGVSDDHFAPNRPVTREQIATILFRYCQAAGGAGSLKEFPDNADVSAFAADAMGWAVENGLINGVSSGGKAYLRPRADATRAQIAAIMVRFTLLAEELPCEHDYVTEAVAPTCTEAGGNQYTCTKCGENHLEDAVPALGHEFLDGVCTRCGELESNETA